MLDPIGESIVSFAVSVRDSSSGVHAIMLWKHKGNTRKEKKEMKEKVRKGESQ